MDFAGISYIAVVVAAVAAFAAGSAYYGLLGKPWMKAARLDPTGMKMSPVLLATSLVGDLVMAWVLAGVIGHLGTDQVTIWNGIVAAFFVWLGFIATTIAVNQRYEGFGWNLTVIDAGHWLLAVLVMGAVIGAFGV